MCCLFFYDIQILITPLVSFGHCVVWSSMIYRFWLPLGIFWPLCCLFFYDIQILITPWYLLAIVLSVLLWYTDSDYPLVSFGHCVVFSSMINRFWLHPWYPLSIVLSVLLWYTDSDYPLGIFWPLCCLFFHDLQILITPLVSFGHCVVCFSMIYRFWLHPWYLLAIVLSVLLWYTDYDYPLGIFWPLRCLFFYDIQILITPLVYFGHCVVCSSMIYRFWLHPWYLLAIVLSVLLWYTDSDYTLGIFWPLCCLFFYDIQILITPWYLLSIVLSVLLWYTDSDYPLGIFCPLCCLFFYDLQILITPLVSFGHFVVCSSMIYSLWLPSWYLLAIVLSVLLWYTYSAYPLGIFWPLCCLFFYDLQILITPLVYFGHCVVCSSMIYRFWLPLGIFWPLCCVFFYDIQILIIPLVSFGHCVVFSSMIYRFWLPPWYLLSIVLSVLLWYRFLLPPWYILAIVLSVLLWYTDSDYPLVSFGHCVVCSSMIYRFSLPPWYLLAIVLSFPLWYTDSDYTLGIFWPFCCLFFYDIQTLITLLVSFGHCVVCSSMI